MKRLKVPYFKQDTNYNCGPAALQMVLSFLGKMKSEGELSRRLGARRGKGTSQRAMVRVARKMGFRAHTKRGATIDYISKFIKEGSPVIVNYIEPKDNEGHFAVVTGVINGRVVLNDPWNGRGFKIRRAEFLRRWRSEAKESKRWLLVVRENNYLKWKV